MQPEWEIWLDTNISPAIYSLSLHHKTDLEIYQLARTQGKVILLSKDADFPELISRLGAPPKLINLKIGNCDNRSLWEFIQPNIKNAIDLLMNSDIDIIEFE
jgi:predicted nuclease of predicted toxin-antitoxin system